MLLWSHPNPHPEPPTRLELIAFPSPLHPNKTEMSVWGEWGWINRTDDRRREPHLFSLGGIWGERQMRSGSGRLGMISYFISIIDRWQILRDYGLEMEWMIWLSGVGSMPRHANNSWTVLFLYFCNREIAKRHAESERKLRIFILA